MVKRWRLSISILTIAILISGCGMGGYMRSDPQKLSSDTSLANRCLYIGIDHNCLQAVKEGIRYGADVNSLTGATWGGNADNPLWDVIEKTKFDIVRELLDAGADANYARNKTTLLHKNISAANNMVITELLLSHGADPNQEDKNGRTPFEYDIRTTREINLDKHINLYLMYDTQIRVQAMSNILERAQIPWPSVKKLIQIIKDNGLDVSYPQSLDYAVNGRYEELLHSFVEEISRIA